MSCILIVDDEPLVGAMLETALGQLGYDVLLATDGMQALTLYRANPQSVDLVMLDVNMPWLDGPGTFRKLQQINPHVRTCFITADGGTYTAEELLELGAVRVFHKPFQMGEITRGMKQLLGH